jgi:hypothetical protein
MPVASGFHVRLMSPLGIYPVDSIILADAAFIASPELCFSIVRIVKEDWGFSEVDSLAPLDIPLLGGLILSGAGYPYPFSGVTLESDTRKALTPECIAECRQHLLTALEEQKVHEGPAAILRWDLLMWERRIVHRPPILGGKAYEFCDYGGLTERVRDCIALLGTASPVVLRGVASLIKAQMAWRHGEFADAACIYLWIALDAAHSLTLQKLRNSGVQNPTSRDASDHFDEVAGLRAACFAARFSAYPLLRLALESDARPDFAALPCTAQPSSARRNACHRQARVLELHPLSGTHANGRRTLCGPALLYRTKEVPCS